VFSYNCDGLKRDYFSLKNPIATTLLRFGTHKDAMIIVDLWLIKTDMMADFASYNNSRQGRLNRAATSQCPAGQRSRRIENKPPCLASPSRALCAFDTQQESQLSGLKRHATALSPN
jgi:hypothetical protein